MNISIREFKLWFIISFICFAIAFVERAGRPLILFAIIFFLIGIASWLEHEWNESQKRKNEMEIKKEMQKSQENYRKLRKEMQRLSKIGKKLQNVQKKRKKQPRDFHGRFTRKGKK
jgi:flagellar biosynthesis component FlhA